MTATPSDLDAWRAFVTRIELGGAGRTVAIKDCIDIAGLPTRAGSAAFTDAQPASAHADVVRKLIDGGWRIVAKTAMHELAYGMTGINEVTGTPVNPRDPQRIPGGSSSGSAVAVAAGLVDVAIGSDTGGSIRLPAACCGVIGMKPTFGRVSRRGVYPLSSTLDCVGPFARDVSALAAAMETIADGFDSVSAQRPLADARVRVLDVPCDPAVRATLLAALAVSGWHSMPANLTLLPAAFDAGLTLINAETFAAFGHLVGSGKLGADIEQRLGRAGQTSVARIAEAGQVRTAFSAEVDRLLDGVDALVLPTLPSAPPTLNAIRRGVSVVALSTFVRPFNLSGHPALSLPLPVTDDPVPVSLQLVGRKGDDELLCALAQHLCPLLDVAHTDFHRN
jgi:amidase